MGVDVGISLAHLAFWQVMWALHAACTFKSHLTYGASVHPEKAVMYTADDEGRKICGDLLETTVFKSYTAKKPIC